MGVLVALRPGNRVCAPKGTARTMVPRGWVDELV